MIQLTTNVYNQGKLEHLVIYLDPICLIAMKILLPYANGIHSH